MANKAKIFYFALSDEMTKEEKLKWFKTIRFEEIPFIHLVPDKNHNWVSLAEANDWESLLPVCSKDKGEKVIFTFSSLGVSTNRDEWVYDFSQENLRHKMQFFIEKYNKFLAENDMSWNEIIKWSRDLKKKFEQKRPVSFDKKLIVKANYRPFVVQFWYAEKVLNDILTQNHYDIFGSNLDNPNWVIYFSGGSASKPFQCLATNQIAGLDFLEKTQSFPLYRYDKAGNRVDNLTNWGLEQFRSHYSNLTGFDNLSGLGKLEIFYYVYAVLHNPAYRQKYELNLKREFPRLPFYPNFGQWVTWGKTLMDLHLNYETVTKYPLKRQDLTGFKNLSGLKVKLKANKLAGTLEIDEQTTLQGVPETAWEYKLGNRSALEWILAQYKEKKISDSTIAEHFDTYRFADYKEQVIELLQRVCTVSVKTMEIIKQMGKPQKNFGE